MIQDSQIKHSVEKIADSNFLRTSRIIKIGQISMAIILFLLSLYLFFSNGSNKEVATETHSATGMINLLTQIVIVMMFILYPASFMLYSRLLKRRFQANKPGEDIESYLLSFMAGHRIADIIRDAFFEGVAYLGIVVIIIATSNNVIQENDIYWINFLPLAAYFLLFLYSFPTKKKLFAAAKKYITILY